LTYEKVRRTVICGALLFGGGAVFANSDRIANYIHDRIMPTYTTTHSSQEPLPYPTIEPPQFQITPQDFADRQYAEQVKTNLLLTEIYQELHRNGRANTPAETDKVQ
jgi:hypothetical protein